MYVLHSFMLTRFQYQFWNFDLLKFIYSEKATKFWGISTLLLSYAVPVKSKVEISQNFVAFSEYMNFNFQLLIEIRIIMAKLKNKYTKWKSKLDSAAICHSWRNTSQKKILLHLINEQNEISEYGGHLSRLVFTSSPGNSFWQLSLWPKWLRGLSTHAHFVWFKIFRRPLFPKPCFLVWTFLRFLTAKQL